MLKKLVGSTSCLEHPAFTSLLESLALVSASVALQGTVLTEQSNRLAVKKKVKKKSAALEASPLEERMLYFKQIDYKSALEKLHDRMYVQEMLLCELSEAWPHRI